MRIREAPTRRTALGAERSVVECGTLILESSGAEGGMAVVESDDTARGLRTLSERVPA